VGDPDPYFRHARRLALVWLVGATLGCLWLVSQGWAAVLEPVNRCMAVPHEEALSSYQGYQVPWRGGVDCRFHDFDSGRSQVVHLGPEVQDLVWLAVFSVMSGFLLMALALAARQVLTRGRSRL
jgi:hypothetical protein